jgi:RimJ/RimL family protein N-acetyltransferase
VRDLSEIERPPELTDGRLRLRALRAEDKAAVVAALNDELVGRFLWQPPFPYKDSDFDEWFAGNAGRWATERHANWAVTSVAEDDWLGSIGLDIAEERQVGEIGYHVGPWARRAGVATAATRLVRDWALDELGLERVEICADVDNIASQRVALAAGLHREGVLRGYLTARGIRRDMVSFAIVPTDSRDPVVPLPRPELDDGFIVVRPLEPDDAPAVTAACQDPLIQERCYFVPSPYTLADAERFIAESRQQLVAGTGVHCAVCAGPGFVESAGAPFAAGELLGAIDLISSLEREAAETGYWVKREARGRGVATAALRLMAAFAFERVGVERLELMAETPNVASQRLAEKLGFRREGVARGYLASRGERDRDLVDPAHGRIDQVVFALLRPEWEALAGRS